MTFPNDLDQPDERSRTTAEHKGFEHVGVLLAHMRLEWLLQHFPSRLVWAVYVCVNGFITIGLLAVLALLTGSPFVFPSLGPTAYLFFFSPMAEASSPRNTILGHAIGPHLWLCCLCAHSSLKPSFRRAPRRSCCASPGRSALTLGYGSAHGSVPGKPSARRSNNPDRFARDHLSTQGTRHHRDRRDPAYRASPRNQPARRNPVSALEKSHALETASLLVHQQNHKAATPVTKVPAFRPTARYLGSV